MKTVKFIGQRPVPNPIRRVSDAQAQELVSRGDWQYCGKETWKRQVRDVKIAELKKAVAEGEKAIAEGRVSTHEEVMDRMEKKYGKASKKES